MLFIISLFLISFITNLSLGLLILKRPSLYYKKINTVFSYLCFACALWVLNGLFIFISMAPASKLFWIRMSFGIGSFVPAFFFHLSLIFPNYQYEIDRLKKILIYFPTVFFLSVFQTHLIVESIIQREPIVLDYGFVHPFFSIYLVTFFALGLYFLLKTHKKSVGVYRLQIKYCFLGMLISIIAALVFNILLPILGTSRYSKIGPSFTMIYVGFVTYAIVKHRLMDINIVLKKGTTYVLLMLLLFVPSFILLILSQNIFFGKINYIFSILIFALIFLVAIFFHKIKPRTEKAVERLLFKDRYNYRETLGKFSKAMVTILDLQSLAKRIIETTTQTMGVEKASFFY